jgi:hypothetical protein
MDTVNKLIKKIRKEKNIDITNNIEVIQNTIILKNNDTFDFRCIFSVNLNKTELQKTNKFMPIGMFIHNNVHVCVEYCDIFLSYYAMFNETENKFVLVPLSF